MDDTQTGQEGKKESEPYEVAKQGYEALMNGDKHVYAASLKTKIEGAIANFVPDAVKAAMHEKMAKPVEK
jgi:short-subunit dehydrogenase